MTKNTKQPKADHDKEKIESGFDEVQSKISELEKSCENFEHRYKVALADYQNLLKQTAREKEEFGRFATANFVHQILPVYDNLKMSFAHFNGDDQSWLKGIEYIIKQFGDVLEKLGIEEVKTVGEKFDYHTMEAVSQETTEDEKQDGLVAKELKAGYKLHGKIISPARVVVWEYKK